MAEDRLGGVEREVAEVLVVDGVELVLVDQAHDVGELHRQHAGRGERDLHAGDEVVEVRHLSEDVVAEEEVGVAALGGQLVRQLDAEEAHHGRHALLLGGRGHVGRRLDAEDRDAGLDEPLQEVAVVARQLDHLARRAVAEPVDHLVGVGAGVLHPAVGERREVGVLGEDVLGADVLLQLHEPALAADVDVERVERLHRVDLVGPAGSSRRAATCRGRRRCPAAARRRTGMMRSVHLADSLWSPWPPSQDPRTPVRTRSHASAVLAL